MSHPPGPAAKTPLVLIADDDEVARIICREALAGAGFAVEELDNGSEVLPSFQRLAPDIVILDVVMPGLDGFAACVELRKCRSSKHVPVLMITAADDVDSVERAYHAGATDFMVKPFHGVMLAQRVRYMYRSTQAFSELQKSQSRLVEAQRIAKLGSWDWNALGELFHCSEETCRIFGFDIERSDIHYAGVLERIHSADRNRVEAMIDGLIRTGHGFDIDFRIELPDGNRRIIAMKGNYGEDDRGCVRIYGTCQDITERKQIESRIHHLAHHDALTDLPNRVLFRDRLSNALARAKRDDAMVAVLCLDLDRFKEINDTLGHAVGDQLLQAVSSRLSQEVRETDTIARLGGDEFAIVEVDVDQPESARALSERLIDCVSRPFDIDGHQVLIETSIGVSIFPSDASNTEQLLMNADIALYKAKEEKQQTYRFFESGMEKRLRIRKEKESDIRLALKEGWLELYYQPQIDTAKGSIVALEALVRIRHPRKGLLPPGQFIPLAEEMGLIIPIGEWILRTACGQAVIWNSGRPEPIRMAVNVSPVQFRQSDLVETVTNVLRDTGLDANLLELEITESLLMDNTSETVDVLKELQVLGVRIAMDDFGTGYSSLTYLRLFPFDRIKIDRSFINELDNNPEAAVIVRAIIAMGKSLKIMTTAEGIETSAQLEFLREHACDELQGFFFSKPVTANEITDRIGQDSSVLDKETA